MKLRKQNVSIILGAGRREGRVRLNLVTLCCREKLHTGSVLSAECQQSSTNGFNYFNVFL